MVLGLPQRAQRADGLPGMSPLTNLKAKSGKWKVAFFTFQLERLLSTFHFPLSSFA
jgi:hypothetical protein